MKEYVKKTDNPKMGAPRKEIDFAAAEKLASLHCTAVEICGWFGISEETLNTRLREHYGLTFSEWFKTYSADGKVSLRRWQYEAAQKGSNAMLIWLGKQYLGQTEKVETFNSDGRATDTDTGPWKFEKPENEE